MLMAIDPVCKMQVDEKKSLKSAVNGKDYYFCSPACKQNFENNPRKFIK